MANIIENADPKRNPVTTLLGGVFMSISATMYCIKYIIPAFFELKAEVPYEWHTPLLFPSSLTSGTVYLSVTGYRGF